MFSNGDNCKDKFYGSSVVGVEVESITTMFGNGVVSLPSFDLVVKPRLMMKATPPPVLPTYHEKQTKFPYNPRSLVLCNFLIS